MKLNFKVSGEGEPVLILHGLLGSLDNWQTIARKMSEKFKVYIIDQRNHGKSPHSSEMNYKVMADDVVELMDDENIPSAFVIGHSMGGKTAMQLAAEHPERVEKLVVVDIAPKEYEAGHDKIFEALYSLNLGDIQSREDADEMLAKKISDYGIRQFLLKNLSREKEGFEWKINLEDIHQNYDKITSEIHFAWPFDKPVLFIRGGKSDYITEADFDQIHSLFPNSEIKTIKEAGHWVHAEAPDQILEIVSKFLQK